MTMSMAYWYMYQSGNQVPEWWLVCGDGRRVWLLVPGLSCHSLHPPGACHHHNHHTVFWCSFAILQGATILSLTCVTLNQATLLFCENKIEKITQKRVSLFFFSKSHKSQWSPCAIAYWEDNDVSLRKVTFIKKKGDLLFDRLLLDSASCSASSISQRNIWKVNIIRLFNLYRVVLKEYTQTCTIVAHTQKGDDPKKLLYFIFFFPAAILGIFLP